MYCYDKIRKTKTYKILVNMLIAHIHFLMPRHVIVIYDTERVYLKV